MQKNWLWLLLPALENEKNTSIYKKTGDQQVSEESSVSYIYHFMSDRDYPHPSDENEYPEKLPGSVHYPAGKHAAESV